MSRISRAIVGWFGIALAGAAYLQAARPQESSLPPPSPQAASARLVNSRTQPSDSIVSPQRALLDKYCVTCHNERRRTAELTLDKMDVEHVNAGAEVWEKVVRKLRSGTMPPAGMPRPDKATYDSFATWLETALDHAGVANPNPGRPTVHRLNRVEYTNAIRDLLALEIDGRSLLPADEFGYGFDNIADVLSLSPGLLDRYMSAAWKISRLTIGDPAIRPTAETYRVSRNLSQEDRVSDDLPWGSRGGIAIRHHFPLDGEYVLSIRMQRQFNVNRVRGLAIPNQIDLRLDGARIKLFTVGGECNGVVSALCAPKGLGLATSEYEQTADDDLKVRFPAKAGTRLVGVTFLERTLAPEGVSPARLPVQSNSNWNNHDRVEMGVDSVQIAGPFDAEGPGETPSRRQIFVCRPTRGQDGKPCATKILTALARRAYRRPATEEDVQTLLSFYQVGQSKGGFEAGIRFALERILVSPEFLFRIERDPANMPRGAAHRISDLELASRLSFFLWSSIPDDELLDVAARGNLKNPMVLEQQVRRMLGDVRATALVSNFGGQWLYVRNMRAVTPDPQQFPEFDDNLREAFRRETELFVESQLREDRSVLDLLTANYTFINERLAKHYRIPNVYGNHFRRVTLGDTRAGLLGQGSILTVTSYSTRTSPVVRGKWLLENFLGAPPPPPPPNVPALKENDESKPTTVRERLEQHRRNPVCAACHTRMDPLGFALENFDGIGRWRNTSEANTPIDASGALPDGTKFDGPAEFRKALLSHREEFIKTVTERLLTYALGRGIEYYDMPAMRKITRDAAATEHRWSSIILGIAKSIPFQMRKRSES